MFPFDLIRGNIYVFSAISALQHNSPRNREEATPTHARTAKPEGWIKFLVNG
jgi:hypothetical protein